MRRVQSDPTSHPFVIRKYVLLLPHECRKTALELSDGRASVTNGLGGSFRCGWDNNITNISRCLGGAKMLGKPLNVAKMACCWITWISLLPCCCCQERCPLLPRKMSLVAKKDV